MRTRIAVASLIVLSGLCVYLTNTSLDRHRTPQRALEETFYLPGGSALRTASLGFTSLISDILWIKTILYYGRHTVDEDNPFYELVLEKQRMDARGGHETRSGEDLDFAKDPRLTGRHSYKVDEKTEGLLYGLLERVVELEPHFMPPYEFGSLVVTIETHDTRRAVGMLKQGLEKNPAKWEIPYYLGYLELFYGGNNQEAFRWLSRAMALPGSPPFLQHLYYSYLKKERSGDFYIEYLRGLYETTENEEIRNSIRELIGKLEKI